MEKVLVSSCLAGNKVRYNASCLSVSESHWNWLQSNVELVIFCPEVSAGLPIPRAPAEIIVGSGIDVLHGASNVIGNNGVDVTKQFVAGAHNALRLCQQKSIKYAILTEGSPSCGSDKIYDGTFSRVKKDGSGVTTALLESKGIIVFSQHTVIDLIRRLEKKRSTDES